MPLGARWQAYTSGVHPLSQTAWSHLRTSSSFYDESGGNIMESVVHVLFNQFTELTLAQLAVVDRFNVSDIC